MGSNVVVGLDQVGPDDVALVGGKAAQLGALARRPEAQVPPGFCVTTEAHRAIVGASPAIAAALDALAGADPDDPEGLADRARRVRELVGEVVVPDDLRAAIADAAAALGDVALVVRSSATTEDLPAASAAGQHDSFLHVLGADAVVDAVVGCWASLHSDRAVAYRARRHLDPRDAAMAVVVQVQVEADAAGVLFTADPVTGSRRVATIEAVVGLADALVAGQVVPDRIEVRDGAVAEVAVAPGRDAPVLDTEGALALAALGRRLADELGGPQDVEWCRDETGFRIVQSRPITTAYPVPEAADDALHVYVSVGHQQMMTDAMAPLGWSVWQLIAMAPMHVAGGRLFVDVTARLATPSGRRLLLDGLGRSDPLVRDALETLLERGVVEERPDPPGGMGPPPGLGAPMADADPARVEALLAAAEASKAAARARLEGRAGGDLFDAVREDVAALRTVLFEPASLQLISTAVEAGWWLDEHLRDWLDEPGAADALTLAAPGNVSSEMGLAVLDVADAIRPHPEVVAWLRRGGDLALDDLDALEGGDVAHRALAAFLDRYGMRCEGEIDLTRPRWRDDPSALVPVLLAAVDHAEPGAADQRTEAGRRAAAETERDVLERIRRLPDGDARAREAKAMIDRVRTFAGYREHPKEVLVERLASYRRALWREAEHLVARGVLDAVDDVAMLTFDELEAVVRGGDLDPGLVAARRAAHRRDAALVPPRVLTSDGERLEGRLHRDGVPPGALVGVAVSAGVAEGRARVVDALADASFEPGDVLVTRATDPSWSPVFVTVVAVVTEVGGRTSHGSVVAREYGLPAVVGVAGATEQIRDGERVRVHGTEGYVELLDRP